MTYSIGSIIQITPDQTNRYDTYRPYIIVAEAAFGYLIVPLTTQESRNHRIRIEADELNGLKCDSFAKTSSPWTTSDERIVYVMGVADKQTTASIRDAVASWMIPALAQGVPA